MRLQVLVTSPGRLLFDGVADRVVCPGERGTFEVLPLHRPLISRLAAGMMEIDQRAFHIRRGAMRVLDDVVTVVVELP